MNSIYTFIIFLLILFIYLHVVNYNKKNNDTEIYEIDNSVSKPVFENILNLKQPVFFMFENDYMYNINYDFLNNVLENEEIELHNCNDNDNYFFREKYSNLIKLKNTNEKYISENNYELLSRTKIVKYLNNCDGSLRPPMVTKCQYDIVLGTKESYTNLKTELNFRNFILVNHGKIELILISPKYKDVINTTFDNDNFIEYTTMTPFNSNNKNVFENIEFKRVMLNTGNMMYIPVHWYYSIKILTDDTVVCGFKYNTIISNICSIPKHMLKYLEIMNTKYNITKKYDNIIVNENKNIKKEEIKEEIKEEKKERKKKKEKKK